MPTVNCQYTGIQFEAASQRTKTHPQVVALLAEANKRGTYRAAIEALAEAKDAGMTSIEDVLAYVSQAVKVAKAERSQLMAEYRQRQREAAEKRTARRRQNEFLRAHGYTWRKTGAGGRAFGGAVEVDRADFAPQPVSAGWDAGDPDSEDYDWALIAPDGRVVTVAQALTEIGETR